MIKNPVLFLFSLFFLFGSCITHKKTVYFQPKQKEPASYKIPQAPAQTIKPNDELLIYVKSEDNISFTQNAPTAIGNDQAIRDYNYSVDRDGNIYYPVIGNFSVKGMTVDEASQKLKEALNSYYNQPEVRIRYNYKIITVLGEVGSPGVLNYSREQITIFEVLAMAGEISETGNRKNVYLVRKDGDEVTRYNIDLTREDIVLSDYYYMHPEDVLYVKPYRTIRWDNITTPVSLITSTVTAALLLINFMYADFWQF